MGLPNKSAWSGTALVATVFAASLLAGAAEIHPRSRRSNPAPAPVDKNSPAPDKTVQPNPSPSPSSQGFSRRRGPRDRPSYRPPIQKKTLLGKSTSLQKTYLNTSRAGQRYDLLGNRYDYGFNRRRW